MAVIKQIQYKQERSPNRLLLVEDDPDVAALFRNVLKTISPGTELHWHMTAEDAINALEQDARYALVICDQQLGGAMTGLELWNRCSRLYPELPYVMVSSLPPSQFFGLVGAGNLSPLFLPKPLVPERCRALLTQFLPAQTTAKAA